MNKDGQTEKRPLPVWDQALSAVAEGIVVTDATLPDNPIVYLNAGFERLTGYSAAETLGSNCRFLQGPDTDRSTLDRLSRAIAARQEITVEILNYRKSGEPFWNRLSITPVRGADGEVTHFIGVQSDISEQKRAEAALRAAKEALEKAGKEIRRDLQAAARIQRSLLPMTLPQLERWRFAWTFRPSAELAGDTLNIFSIDQEHVAVYLVDVSGHGVAAALLSVTLSRWLSTIPGQVTLLTPDGQSATGYRLAAPVEVARRLNQQFPLNIQTPQYFTLVYGLLNTRTGEFRYVSAGHPPLVYVPNSGTPEVLSVAGFPIGLVDGVDYDEQKIKLGRGDRLVLCTDGLLEATSPAGEEWGADRLACVLSGAKDLTVESCLEAVVCEAERWRQQPYFDDDISAIAIAAAG